jgi:integrase
MSARRTRYPNIYYRETPQGRAYEVSFYDHAKRRRWQRVEGFDDIAAAKIALAEAQGKTRKGERTAPAGVTLTDVASRYLASVRFAKLGAWTQKNYRAALENEILPRLGRMKIAAVDDSTLAGLIDELERREKKHGKGKLRQNSVENILKPLRGVFRHAVKEKLLSASPFAALEREDRPAPDAEPHEPHEWTDEEIERLLACARRRASEQKSRYDYAPLLTVAAKAGLRLGELLGLDWPDCELVRGAGALNIRRQWTRLRETAAPKAGSRRTVPISDELVRTLLELKMAAANKSGPVFVSRTGSRLSHRNVERRGFDAAAEDAGITGVTLHDLRHAYGSRLASCGLSARQIADAMGHKRTSTTEIYIQRFNGRGRGRARPAGDERLAGSKTGSKGEQPE